MELRRPETADAAAAALDNGSVALAGGTDLVPLLRDGLVHADTLVRLDAAIPRGIRLCTPTSPSTSPSPSPSATAVRIGAGTTLGELETDGHVPHVLKEACALAASPQLRAMGTIGGNLLQATRCWYWRLKFPCRLHGGDRCHARDGQHREHAIFANDVCASAHPSDPAAALLALGATVRTNRRELPVAELYRVPTEQDPRTTTLEAGEVIVELEAPVPDASTYLKAMDRKRWSFALVGVAAARFGDGTRIALAGVAPVPWLLDGPGMLDRATPLPQNAYKVELARALVGRALQTVA